MCSLLITEDVENKTEEETAKEQKDEQVENLAEIKEPEPAETETSAPEVYFVYKQFFFLCFK